MGVIFINPYRFAGFDPLTLNPTLWLDASDTSTITASSGAVSEWRDKSGNAYHATQATASAQPTTGTRTQNGLNVIDFDGTADTLQTGSVVTQITSSRAVTQFIVMKSDRTSAASEGIVGGQRGNYDFNTGWLAERRTTFLAWTYGHGGTTIVSTSYNASRFSNSSTSAMIYTQSVNTSARAAYVNSTAQTLTTFDGTMTLANFMSTGSGNHTINIGARGSLTGYPFDGFIAEILIYDSVLSDDNRAKVHDYLNAKWSVY